MKKITLLSFLLFGFLANSQSKSTGVVTLTTNMTANLTLNNTTSKATLVLTGPSDRWFALQFGSFAVGGGMAAGQDLVYANATTLVDANHNGVGVAPSVDAINNWTVTTNTVATGIRTITAERNFSTGDTNDYTFNYADPSIDFVWARFSSASYSLAYHGGINRGYQLDKPLTTLGIEDFSLNASSVFPNPANGSFTITTKSALETVTIYSQTGAIIKTIEVKNAKEKAEVLVNDLSTGVYLIELKSNTDKSWKKVMVN